MSQLIEAVKLGDPELIQELLATNADPNAIDGFVRFFLIIYQLQRVSVLFGIPIVEVLTHFTLCSKSI